MKEEEEIKIWWKNFRHEEREKMVGEPKNE